MDRGGVEFLPVDFGPEIQLVSAAVTFVAVVTLAAQVDGECASAWRGRAVNRARTVQLITRAGDGFEAELRQHTFHRDFGAQSVEVDVGHRGAFLSEPSVRKKQDRSVPLNP
jgi:tellurite resistance protein